MKRNEMKCTDNDISVILVEAPAGPDSGENPDGTVDPSSGPTLDANGVEIPGTGPHPDPAPEKSWVERLIWEDIRTYYTTGAPIPAVSTCCTCSTDPNIALFFLL